MFSSTKILRPKFQTQIIEFHCARFDSDFLDRDILITIRTRRSRQTLLRSDRQQKLSISILHLKGVEVFTW